MVFNIHDEQQEIYAVDSAVDSRLEIISRDIKMLNKEDLEQQIINCFS